MAQQTSSSKEAETEDVKARTRIELLAMMQRETRVTRLPVGDAEALSFAFVGGAARLHTAAWRHFRQTSPLKSARVVDVLEVVKGQQAPSPTQRERMLGGFAALVERAAGLEPGARMAPDHLLRLLEGVRDTPLPEWCETFVIPQTDPRVALRGALGVRVKPEWPGVVPAWSAVGPYRSEVWLKHEYSAVQDPPAGWANGCPLLFAAARGAYIVESGHFDPVEEYGHVKGFGFDFDHRRQPEDYRLVFSAYQCGNATMGFHERGEVGNDNCGVFEFLVAGSPALAMFLTRDLHPGEELLYCYGWDGYFAPAASEIDTAVAAELRVRRELRQRSAVSPAASGDDSRASRDVAAMPVSQQEQQDAPQEAPHQQQQQQQQQAQQHEDAPHQQQDASEQQQRQQQQEPEQRHEPAEASQPAMQPAPAMQPGTGPRRIMKRCRKQTAAARPELSAQRSRKRGLDGAGPDSDSEDLVKLAAAAVAAQQRASRQMDLSNLHRSSGGCRMKQRRGGAARVENVEDEQAAPRGAPPTQANPPVEVIDLTGDD